MFINNYYSRWSGFKLAVLGATRYKSVTSYFFE